jgi:hypothetical protein
MKTLTITHHYRASDEIMAQVVHSTVLNQAGRELARYPTGAEARAFIDGVKSVYAEPLIVLEAHTADL